jgi:L-histidine Nalpha-methyltransferase
VASGGDVAGAVDGGASAMREDVAASLRRPQKEISPKYFYDRRGSQLFETITRLPEYYPTRAERELLERLMPEWLGALRPGALVELGAGAADKTRVLLDVMRQANPGATYVPMDISARFLEEVAVGLRVEYPGLRIRPVATDITAALDLPADLPHPVLFAFLGGTIGNFRHASAHDLLRRIRHAMSDGDALLLGLDLEKPVDVLEAAYNDSGGVTAEFNRNILRVLNRELGADFDVDAFRHHAFYNQEKHRIEMHLVTRRPLLVTVPGAGTFPFREGESVRTEISCKYDRPRAEALLGEAGLALARWAVAPPGFALALAVPG